MKIRREKGYFADLYFSYLVPRANVASNRPKPLTVQHQKPNAHAPHATSVPKSITQRSAVAAAVIPRTSMAAKVSANPKIVMKVPATVGGGKSGINIIHILLCLFIVY